MILAKRIKHLLRILFIEKRLPTKFYNFLNILGLKTQVIHSAEGLIVKRDASFANAYYEIWQKKKYDIPGFDIRDGINIMDIGAQQGFFSLYAAYRGGMSTPSNQKKQIIRFCNGISKRIY